MSDETQEAAVQAAEGDAVKDTEAERTVPRDVPAGGVQDGADPGGPDDAVAVIRLFAEGTLTRDQARRWLQDRGL